MKAPRRRRGRTKKESPEELAAQVEVLSKSLYAKSTLSARENAKTQILEFNQRMMKDCTGAEPASIFVPYFNQGGHLTTAASSARSFFAARRELARSTLTALKSNIKAVYANECAGPTPWDHANTDPEAPMTRRFIDKLIREAPESDSHPPISHGTLKGLMRLWQREDVSHMLTNEPPISSFAMAACASFLRGTGGRPQEAVMLRKEYIKENILSTGVRDGLNIFFPEKHESGAKLTLKGRTEPLIRFKVMPEKLDCGLPVSAILWDFLAIAPSSGPLFQKTTKTGPSVWSGAPWSVGTITEKLRKGLMDRRMGLGWTEEVVAQYSAHCFRSTTSTSMSLGGVAPALVSSVLGHKTNSTAQEHYIQFSKEDVRRALAVTGHVFNPVFGWLHMPVTLTLGGDLESSGSASSGCHA